MDEKKLRLILGISLMILGVGSLVVNLIHLFGGSLPDVLSIVWVVLDIISIILLVYSSLKLFAIRKR